MTDNIERCGDEVRFSGDGQVASWEAVSLNKRPELFGHEFVISVSGDGTLKLPSGNGEMVAVSDLQFSKYVRNAEFAPEIKELARALPEKIKEMYVEYGDDAKFHMLFGGKGEATMWAIYDPESRKYSYIDSYRRHTLDSRLRNQPIIAVNASREDVLRTLKRPQWKASHFSHQRTARRANVRPVVKKVDDESYLKGLEDLYERLEKYEQAELILDSFRQFKYFI